MPLKPHVLLLILILMPLTALGAKTDIVVLKNGDRITGEVKRLQSRLLQFSTDAMGTINIEWQYIERIISTDEQSVETTDGRLYLGRLTSLDDSEAIGVQTGTKLVELDADEVFSAWPVKATFWERSDLDISVGFDYQKSTEIGNLNFAADWQHRKVDRLTEVSLRTNITRQETEEDQQRSQITFSQQYIHANRRFTTWMGSAESNESLDLDHRVFAGGMYGTYVMRKSDRLFAVGAGLVANRERYTGSGNTDSLEAVLDSQFALYRYADPERSLTSRLTLFPSLTESGRIRSDFRTTFRLELINDLFWSMELYYQRDSNPPTINATKEDYGITTSFGWSP